MVSLLAAFNAISKCAFFSARQNWTFRRETKGEKIEYLGHFFKILPILKKITTLMGRPLPHWLIVSMLRL